MGERRRKCDTELVICDSQPDLMRDEGFCRARAVRGISASSGGEGLK